MAVKRKSPVSHTRKLASGKKVKVKGRTTRKGSLIKQGKARAEAARGKIRVNPITGKRIAVTDAGDHLRTARFHEEKAKQFPSTSSRYKAHMKEAAKHKKIAAKKS